MKKLFILFVCTATLPAHAKNGYHLSLFGGSSLNSTIKQGTATKNLNSGVHYGVEYGYNYNGLLLSVSGVGVNANIPGSKGKVTSTLGLINVGYQFNNDGVIKPYFNIGAGIGSSQIQATNNVVQLKTKNTLAYQGNVDIAFAINSRVEVFADYRLTMLANAKYKNSTLNTSTSLRYNTANLGIKILLGRHDQHFDFRSKRF